MKRASAITALLAALGGCGAHGDLMSKERLDKGMVVLLPGIAGAIANVYGIQDGLARGGWEGALPIQTWGWPIPVAGMFLNQTDAAGNRAAGKRLAQTIMDYQDSHPGAPVYIVGHSGGGGVAVFAAEALEDGHSVDGLVLLSASISAGYDLSTALARCRKGIVNFYSTRDEILPATSAVGTVDGRLASSAGLNGFSGSYGRLYQVGWHSGMQRHGNYGGHMDTANSGFVAEYVAPWVTAPMWPAR